MAITGTTDTTATNPGLQGAADATEPTKQADPTQTEAAPPSDTAEVASDDDVPTKDDGNSKGVLGRLTDAVAEGSQKAWQLTASAQRKAAQHKPSKRAPLNDDDAPQPKKDIANAATATGKVIEVTSEAMSDGASKALEKGGDIARKSGAVTKWLGRGKSFALGAIGHYYGDNPVAQTTTGHATASGVKGALDVTSGVAMANAPGLSGTAKALNLGGFVGGLVDGFLDVDNPAKIVTSTLKDANPGAPISGGHNGLVDSGTVVVNVVSGNKKAAYKGAEQMQENAIQGDYSQAGSALTWATAMALGDHETVNKYTDTKAKSGDRGLWLAAGNFLADRGDPFADQGLKVSGFDGADRRIGAAHMADTASDLASAGDPNAGDRVSDQQRANARTVVREAAARELFAADGVDRRRLLEYLPPVSAGARDTFLVGRGRDARELRQHYRVYDEINKAYRITQDTPVAATSVPRTSRVQSAGVETPRLDRK